MRAGALNRRIRIERLDPGQDNFGQENGTWQLVASVAAGVTYAPGAERYAAEDIVAQAAVTFSIRWSRQVKSVGSKDRIVFDGRTFDIRDVREIGRREGLEIDATTRSEDGVSA